MNELWVEKYRPKTIDEYNFQSQEIKDFVNDIINTKQLPHLLLSGVQGTGKSTLAMVLLHELGIDKHDQYYVKPSKKSNISQIRDNVVGFCETLPIGTIKVVVIEEADKLHPFSQGELRTIIEDYSSHVRFIMTCNYLHKIIPAIQSRMQNIKIENFDTDELFDRCAYVLESEGVVVQDLSVFENHIEQYKPDLRKILNNLQQCSKTGVLRPISASDASEGLPEWELAWKGEPSLERLLSLCTHIDENNYEDFYRIMYKNAESLKDTETEDRAIIYSAEHLYKANFVADQEHNMAACLYKIFKDL